MDKTKFNNSEHEDLSTLEAEQLASLIMRRFKADYDFRNQWIGEGGFERSRKIYEAITGSNQTDETIPKVNLVRGAVEDFLSVAIMNIPRAKLKADRFISGSIPEWEKRIRRKVIEQSQEVINAYAESVLMENEYTDEVNEAVEHAAIYGVGYLEIGVDESVDLRDSQELRDLMNKKEELTPEEAGRLKVLSKRIKVKAIDPEGVYWQHHVDSVRKEEMHRVSKIDYASTQSLREAWADSDLIASVEQIRPGAFPYYVHESKTSEVYSSDRQDTQCAVLTTWQMEPVDMERVEPGVDDEDEIVIGYRDWQITKTIIAGGALVSKETWTSKDGPIRLPIIPFYLRESVKHPYGWSIPLELEKSEEFINVLQTLIYKSAKKAASNQGVIIGIPNLGDGDLEEIQYMLEEGGVAQVTGKDPNGQIDLRNMVIPMPIGNTPISPALMQGMSLQMQMFNLQSDDQNENAIGQARSGIAKRTQIAAGDRTKTISITKLNRAVEMVYDSIYELIRLYHTDQIGITISLPGGGRDYIMLNEPYRKSLVVMDDEYVTPENPMGFAWVEFEDQLNSTTLRMKAEADGRGQLPLDMMTRFQIMFGLLQAGAIQPETMRELSLPREIRELDDDNVRKKLEQNPQVAQAMAAFRMMNQVGGGPQPVQGGFGGVPAMQGPSLQQGIDQDPSSPLATQQNPASPQANPMFGQ